MHGSATSRGGGLEEGEGYAKAGSEEEEEGEGATTSSGKEGGAAMAVWTAGWLAIGAVPEDTCAAGISGWSRFPGR